MQRGVTIEWDLESTPLEVRTDSVLGSDDMMWVEFHSAAGHAGRVYLYFKSTLDFALDSCRPRRNLPVTAPSANDKVWRITLTKTAAVRLVIHCNEVEVLNILLSDACSVSAWSTYWNNDVNKIFFYNADTASDYYRAGD